VHGVSIVLLRFPTLNAAGRRKRIAWWAAKTLRVLGMRLEVHGALRPGAKLLVSNHISWIDIIGHPCRVSRGTLRLKATCKAGRC